MHMAKCLAPSGHIGAEEAHRGREVKWLVEPAPLAERDGGVDPVSPTAKGGGARMIPSQFERQRYSGGSIPVNCHPWGILIGCEITRRPC